ncbi:MAG: LytR C-terminal domain-containing protein [Gaiella sp.]
MDLPLHHPRSRPRTRSSFPWRTFAVVAALVAAVELILLVVAGGALLAGGADTKGDKVKKAVQTTPAAKKKPVAVVPTVPAAELVRGRVRVMVLNGNGRTGAAAAGASRVKAKGYKLGFVGNAANQDYPRSIVMYRPGYGGEGKRLARDLQVKQLAPLDGMRAKALRGAHVVLVLGR